MIEKEQRRAQYYIKQRHQQQQKLQRKQKDTLQECILDKISQFDLNALIDFLNQEYDTLLNKNIQLGPQLNKAIAKQYASIKQKWVDNHKQMFLDHLNARGLGVTEQKYLKLIKGEQNIFIRNVCGLSVYQLQETRFAQFYYKRDKCTNQGQKFYIYKQFWVPFGTELQQNEIFSKGFKNRTLSQCESLLLFQQRIDRRVLGKRK